jgi:hypothetical protein
MYILRKFRNKRHPLRTLVSQPSADTIEKESFAASKPELIYGKKYDTIKYTPILSAWRCL